MSKKPRLAFIMDPIQTIDPKKDSTLRLMLEAQTLDWEIHYLEQKDLFLNNERCYALTHPIEVFDNPSKWWSLGSPIEGPLAHFDAVWMRKDPPVTMEYIYTTQLLEKAEREGLLVVNRPQTLRDANEKLFITWFPQCIAPTLVTGSKLRLKQFIHQHQHTVLKPLKGMAGQGIFKCDVKDPNISVIIETLTQDETELCMAQQYIPEIQFGDKRIILIDGIPVPYALARIPKEDDFRGNLMRGAKATGVELTEKDRWICQEIAPTLIEKGVLFAGIDIIGDYLTEINITSPTCIRQLEQIYNINIAGQLLASLEQKINQRA